MKEKIIRYENIKNEDAPAVYVIQEIPGTAEGRPKINIMGAAQYGKFKFLVDGINIKLRRAIYQDTQIQHLVEKKTLEKNFHGKNQQIKKLEFGIIVKQKV